MTTPKPKRRWLRFSLRTLLVFVVVLSVPLTWFAWRLEKARRQREAVEAILGLGGVVAYDYQVDESGEWIEGAEPTAPEWLRKLLGDDFFCDVLCVDVFPAPKFGDDEARHLKGLTELEHLYLFSQISDSGLAHLEGLTKLKTLSLNGTQISDSGLAHLEGLTRLETLYLHGSLFTLDDMQVTGEGIQELQQALPNCRVRRQKTHP